MLMMLIGCVNILVLRITSDVHACQREIDAYYKREMNSIHTLDTEKERVNDYDYTNNEDKN